MSHFNLSGLSHSRWVVDVWQSQIEVMSRVFDEQSHSVVSDVLCDTTAVPRVEVTVCEDQVGCSSEVLLRLSTSEVVKSPLVLRGHVEIFFTLVRESLLIPVVPSEAPNSVRRIITHRHRELIAGLNTPTVAIES